MYLNSAARRPHIEHQQPTPGPQSRPTRPVFVCADGAYTLAPYQLNLNAAAPAHVHTTIRHTLYALAGGRRVGGANPINTHKINGVWPDIIACERFVAPAAKVFLINICCVCASAFFTRSRSELCTFCTALVSDAGDQLPKRSSSSSSTRAADVPAA